MANHGMEIVSPGQAPIKADIVFVHGLRGHKHATWTAGNNIFWPRHLLSKDLPDARIMTWGYDSSVADLKHFASQNSIFGHADNLLMDISTERKTKDEKQRPIIFVGHSLGGLVIKQALIRANEKYNSGQDVARGAVYPNTAGVVFMGTPHRGSTMSSIGEIVRGVARLSFRQPNTHLLRTLSEESDVLEQQRQSFATISQCFPIACIFEEVPVAAGMVVPESSACMDGFRVSRTSIPSNHMEMCKFSGPSDIGYRRTSQFISEFLDEAVSVIALEEPQGNSINGASRTSVPSSGIIHPSLGMMAVPQLEGNSENLFGHKYKKLIRSPPFIRITPPRSRNFTGRSQELLAIHDQLRRSTSSDGDQLKACIIHGLGGVGKTEIAIEYSYLYGKDYDIICWICASSPSEIEHGFRGLGRRLQNHSIIESNDVETIRSCLEVEEFSWLLILDEIWDQEALGRALPNHAAEYASFIITTQVTHTELPLPTREVFVQPLDPVAAVSLLSRFFNDENQSWQMTSKQQQKAATQLVGISQGLPLYIVVAARAIHRTCTILDYVQEYRNVTVSKLANKIETSWTRSSKIEPERVFDRAIGRLQGGSWALMGMLSFFNGAHIAKDMLFGKDPNHHPYLSFLHFGSFPIDDIENVSAHSLVKVHKSESGTFFEVPKAVQQRVLDIMSLGGPESAACGFTANLRRQLGGLEESYERALLLLRSKVPVFQLYESPDSNLITADGFESLISHGVSFCDIAFRIGASKWTNFPGFAKLSIDLVHILWRCRNLEQALLILQQLDEAMDTYTTLYDATLKAQIELLVSRLDRDLTGCHQGPERIERALRLSKKIEVSVTSITDREMHTVLVASLLMEVAFVHLIIGNTTKAQETFIESVETFSKLRITWSDDSYTSAALAAHVGLAFCDLASKRAGEAYDKARKIWLSQGFSVIHSFSSHRVAFSVAQLLASTSFTAEALSLHKRVLMTRQTFCGSQNPLTLQSLQAVDKLDARYEVCHSERIASLQCLSTMQKMLPVLKDSSIESEVKSESIPDKP